MYKERQAKRQSPLTVEDYEDNYREFASDLDLIERVYYGGLSNNQMRAALWPYLFGLVKHRGRFKIVKDNEGNIVECVFIEHEENAKRWQELEKLYYSYQSQWKSIMPDQEMRFSTFRERKSLIERDVIRSDRSHPFYAENSQNLTTFTTLLMTYMMYDFDIGYLQGMSDLAAPILFVFNGDLVKSFWIFVEVMKLFRRNFEFSQKTIHFQLNCLYRLIKITDPKFAQYLSENECSNCFFAFRCIVCQFKREIMKCDDDDDYSKVLTLWDTIWSVQRRHELLTKSKYVHTFTIANGHGKNRNNQPISYKQQRLQRSPSFKECSSKNGYKSPNKPNTPPVTNGTHKNYGNCSNYMNNNYNNNNNYSINNNISNGSSYKANGIMRNVTTNGRSNGLGESYNETSSSSKFFKSNLQSSPSAKSNGSSPSRRATHANGNSINGNGVYHRCGSSPLINGHSPLQGNNNRWMTSTTTANGCSSPLSHSPASPLITNGFADHHSNNHHYQAPVKQEEVVYTKETFYSSFDPNQADVPRFELTETEKFVLSLCLSLIQRERNHILLERMDASEIHQHFINPRIANDLDNFIDNAYHIYHFLITDCDMQLLVKGANGIDLSPSCADAIASSNEDTSDTYDLLKDYLIISQSSYGASQYKYSASQNSWNQFINRSSPMAN